MKKVYKWVVLGIIALSIPVNAGYSWLSNDKTSLDSAEDYQAIEYGSIDAVLFNGRAKPLEGVDFTLYSDNKEIEVYTTDSKGMFNLEYLHYNELYCLRESGVSEGNSLEQYFTLSNDSSEPYSEGVRILKDRDTLSLIYDEPLTSKYKVKMSWVPPIGRPDSVSVTLLRNGRVYDTVDLSKHCNWEYEFTNLLETGEYTVDASVPPSYRKEQLKTSTNGYTYSRFINTIDYFIPKLILSLLIISVIIALILVRRRCRR